MTLLTSFNRLNDLLGTHVPEEARTEQAEKDWWVVYNAVIRNNWIYCSDRMPPFDEEVNVWLDYERRPVATMCFVGYDDQGNHIWMWHNSDERTTLTPKAWQPLPTPPE